MLYRTAKLVDGCGTFKMRITVLSTLCNRKFRVHVALKLRPDICTLTDSFKTLTKLKRTPRKPRNREGVAINAAVGNDDSEELSSPEMPQQRHSFSAATAAATTAPASSKRDLSESCLLYTSPSPRDS